MTELLILSADNATDSWTYSSDEEDSVSSRHSSASNEMRRKPTTPSSSVQSIMQMISNKKHSNDVDTNLLSKVASVINMEPAKSGAHFSHFVGR